MPYRFFIVVSPLETLGGGASGGGGVSGVVGVGGEQEVGCGGGWIPLHLDKAVRRVTCKK